MIELFDLLAVPTAFASTWYFVARDRKRKGSGWFLRNLGAGMVATVFAVIVVVCLSSGGVWRILGYAISALLVLSTWQARDSAMASTPGATAAPDSGDRYSSTLAYPISDTRVAATEDASDEYSAPIDIIQFAYRDRSDRITSRTVEVSGLDDEYFEGWCRARRDVRTFRLDRVVGDVVSMDTGEVRSAFDWAGDTRDHQDNAGIDQESWNS